MKKLLINKFKCALILFVIFCFSNSHAQLGYSIDSLQIKVYTEINYVNKTAKGINVKKVFCDYCSSNQVTGIEDEAIRQSYLKRNQQENVVNNGIKRLAIYIRISKSDFAYMENNQEMSLEKYLVKNMNKNNNNNETNVINKNNKDIEVDEVRISSN